MDTGTPDDDERSVTQSTDSLKEVVMFVDTGGETRSGPRSGTSVVSVVCLSVEVGSTPNTRTLSVSNYSLGLSILMFGFLPRTLLVKFTTGS